MERKPLRILLLIISAIIIFLAIRDFSQASSESIIITEIMYDPEGTDLGYEWIEFKNISDTTISLSGWNIQAGGSSYKIQYFFPYNAQIEPGQYLVVGETNTNADLKTFALGMQNGGSETDAVRLVDNQDQIVDTVLYDENNSNNLVDDTGTIGTNFAFDPPSGYSICRKTETDTDNNAEDFITCTSPTPGSQNEIPPIPTALIKAPSRVFTGQEVKLYGSDSISENGDIISWRWQIGEIEYNNAAPQVEFDKEGKIQIELTVTDEIGIQDNETITISVQDFSLKDFKGISITEVNPAPSELDLNNDDEANSDDEFIEITNLSNSSINLSGLFLADESTKDKPEFTFDEVNLASMEVLVLFKKTTSITLNNSGDTIYLLGPQGQVIDSLKYSSSHEDVSWAKSGNIVFQEDPPTPGLYVTSDQAVLASTGQPHPLVSVIRWFLKLKKYDMLGLKILFNTKIKWHEKRFQLEELLQQALRQLQQKSQVP